MCNNFKEIIRALQTLFTMTNVSGSLVGFERCEQPLIFQNKIGKPLCPSVDQYSCARHVRVIAGEKQ